MEEAREVRNAIFYPWVHCFWGVSNNLPDHHLFYRVPTTFPASIPVIFPWVFQNFPGFSSIDVKQRWPVITIFLVEYPANQTVYNRVYPKGLDPFQLMGQKEKKLGGWGLSWMFRNFFIRVLFNTSLVKWTWAKCSTARMTVSKLTFKNSLDMAWKFSLIKERVYSGNMLVPWTHGTASVFSLC